MQDKKFKLFDTQREGKGLTLDDVTTETNFKKFWRLYKDNFFNRLIGINLILIIGNFPLIFALLAFIGVGQVSYNQPTGDFLSILQGIISMLGGYTPASLSLMSIEGIQNIVYANTTISYILYALSALVLFTFGIVHCGVAYLLRNLSTEKPIFLLSDFFETIKKNWKQALPFGILDAIISALLPYNVISLALSSESYLASFAFWTNVLLLLLYSIMRWYVYLEMVSFDMKVWSMIKNGLRFVILGWKRNLLALLGTIILYAITVLFIFLLSGKLVVISLFIPAFMLFSNSAFMFVYAAWYKIDEIMVTHE